MALAALKRVLSSSTLCTAHTAKFNLALGISSVGMASEHGQNRTNSSLSESRQSSQNSKDGILKFELNDSPCKLHLQRGDITKWFVDGKQDAIVNAANSRLLGGGGVDGAIHRAAGRELYEACYALPSENGVRCNTGDAIITDAFRLPVSKVIHTVGPIYDNPTASANFLRNAYKNSLCRAIENNIIYIAFPAISCGVYGYPYDEAADIALETVNEYSTGLKEVHFVLFEIGVWNEWVLKAEETFKRYEG